MRARFLLCVSYVTLLTVTSLTIRAADAQQTDVTQRESTLAASAGIAVGDLSATTVNQIKDAVAAETAFNSAVSDQASAQQRLSQANSDLSSAKAQADAALQTLKAQGIDPIAAGKGLVTTASQAKLEAAMNAARDAAVFADYTLDQAQRDATMAKSNPKAFSKAELDAIPDRLKNAQGKANQARFDYEHAADNANTQTLAAVQAYNAVQIKLNSATAAQSAAQSNLNNANLTVSRATATNTNMQAAVSQAIGSDATAAVTRASVLANADGAKLLNVVNAQQLVSTGGINLAWLDPKQREAMDASGASAIAKNGIVSVSDLTPAMLAKIVASGAGNITVQGGGIVSTSGSGIVASGAGNIAQLAAVANIVASGAGNIVASGAGNIISTNGGGIVASGAGNIVASGAGNLGAIMNGALANAQVVETALLTAGIKASIIGNDGASIIAKDVAQGLITNDGGSIISNDGASLAKGSAAGLVKTGASSIISNDGASAMAKNAAAVIGTNVADLVAKNVAAGIVASGAGNIISTNGGGIISTNGGGIVATGAGNVGVANASSAVTSANLANLAASLAPRGPMNYKAASDADAAASAAPAAAPAAKTASPTTAALASQTATAPRGLAGGGFAHETQITISGNYDTGPATGQTTKPATTVVASAPAAATTPSVSVSTGPSTIPKNYDPNDWTTWPKADVASFLPPGKTVQQFKAGAEQDLETYKKNLAALPGTGLTKSQQDQKAGMEVQIRSLEFQVDTANRALGLPNSTTTKTTVVTAAPVAAPAPAPVPVMSASAIAATVTLPGDLAAAQQRVNDRAQQMASANQQLQQWQAQRTTTTDPEKLKGLDAAISSAKFQLDVMQQALDRENKNVSDLQASAAKTAALTPAASPAAAPTATPAPAAAGPLKITSTEQKGLEDALRTIPGKLSTSEKKTFNSLSVLAQKAVSKGLTAAEGAELMRGIQTLAQRHPKGIERYKLTSLSAQSHAGANLASPAPHPAGHVAIPAAANSAPAKPAAVATQAAAPVAVKPETLKPHEMHAHPAAAATKPEPVKPVMAHQHPAAHPVTSPKPEAHHGPALHVPALAKPAAAPPKPHIASAPKPTVAAAPKAPKPVPAPPKPAVPVMPAPIRH